MTRETTMRRTLLRILSVCSLVLVVSASVLALADSNITKSTANSTTERVDIKPLADGGCALETCGIVRTNTGAALYGSCSQKDLVGSARTTCLAAWQKGNDDWRIDNGVQ